MCLLRGTDWVFIYNSTFCPHSVFVCFVWIWEQTAIISLYSINWLVFITETECLLRGTDWVFIYNSTFCPHSVFLCFLWIWEQTAIISLYSFNCLVFVTETECVYCAVRAGSLYIIHVIIRVCDRVKAQAVSRQPFTAESRVRSQVSPCRFCDGQSGTGREFSDSICLFGVSGPACQN